MQINRKFYAIYLQKLPFWAITRQLQGCERFAPLLAREQENYSCISSEAACYDSQTRLRKVTALPPLPTN